MTDKEKLDKLVAEIERRYKEQNTLHTSYSCGRNDEDAELLSFYNSMQEEPATSVWHDASEKAEKGKLYLYRTNQNIVDINRSEGKEFPDYCERWAYIDDLLKL